VLDHIGSYATIKHESDCPTQTQQPYWYKLHEIADNVNMKYQPEEGPKLPDLWCDWRH
jgi:hypothetical protein